jgi:homogentisate 1,2-dioxygenase
MPIYHSLGLLPRKRHIALRKPDGHVYNEQLMGNKGFTGPSALLYHIHPPTAVKSIREYKDVRLEVDTDERALKHRHLRTSQIKAGGSPVLDRTPLLFNADAAMYFAVPAEPEERFYRNAMGDEVVYVSEGSGVLESQFGDLPYKEGDYLVIHRGILHRYKMDAVPHRLLVMESRGYIRFPKRYVNEVGQIVEGAPFSERDLRRPMELKTFDESGDFPLLVKQYDSLHEVVLDHHPCDVVGWDGYYYPWAFNIHDFEPITGTIHQPPPIHQTFQGDGFVICSFCPRPYDFHPEAIPAPYNHSNVMSDEVLYYASSEFMSRKGIEYGSITLHPDGIPHGPHPGRYEASIGAERTDELAVMMDTFRPLKVAKQAARFEDMEYHKSWLNSTETTGG